MIVLKAAQEKFLGALQAVSGIVERRHTLPILANVLIRKNGPVIEFTTSDLEIQVRTSAELGGDAGNFATTVGARKLIDILRSLPADQTVTLSSTQTKLTLVGGKSRFTLQTMPADDFPLVQESADFGPMFSVPQKTLKDLLSIQNRQVGVENIQKTVADFYKIKVADMYSKKRPASIARPRQIAMYIAKEMTQKSLPEIGELFGGRDHTTVLHAVRKIAAERQKNTDLNHQLHVLEQTLKG